ncbi:MAG: hypothetical protein ABIG63_02830 [Chloroflexota bacterium]
MAALLVGVPCVVLATGAFYSLSGIHGGRYGINTALIVAQGVLLWVVFRLGGGKRISAMALWMLLITTAAGPLLVGHAMGYGDMHSLAYRLVQEDMSGRYPADWKQLGREELFPRWVGRVTGNEGGGVFGYLRAQAAIGWEGWERINKGRTHIERTGLRVWFAWMWHLVFFFAAGAIAFFAAMRKAPTVVTAGRSTARGIKPESMYDSIAEWGRGPADLPEAGVWSDWNEQQDIRVSFTYEPRTGYPTLQGFLEERVRRSFANVDSRYIESDIRNYLERVCLMKKISRMELLQFVSQYSGPVGRDHVPRIPENMKSAFICRDEPSIKDVIWETDKGYWAMSWSKGLN